MTQTSSGIEPLFKAYYIRRRKINPGDEGARVDFVDQNGDSWMEYPVLHPKFKEWCQDYLNKLPQDDLEYNLSIDECSKEDIQTMFEKSPWYGSEAGDIDWRMRIVMQSVVQRYTTHSISCTINLPKETTEEQISQIYIKAWAEGLKGVTVYREGSRSGVLVSESEKEEFHQHDAPKRPKVLPCEIHITVKNGKEYLVAVGLLDNKPYELFTVENKWNIPKFCVGDIIKVKKGHYDIDIKDIVRIENITFTDMSPEEEDLTRMVSMSLRHGANISFVVEQLNKTKSIVSFSKATARVLKKYIPEGKLASGGCDECGGTLIYEEGCKKCTECGNSKC